MKLKEFLALFLVLVLGSLVINYLNNNSLYNAYGENVVEDKDSIRYITRNEEEIIVGETTDLESGPQNIVTAIVADYRSFDTLGEVTVLFVSSLGVALLLGGNKKRLELNFEPNFMIRVGSKAIVGVIIMSGIYMMIHGHLTPGGGFPGGTMIASSMLLLYLADNSFRANIKGFKLLESVMGSFYVLIGISSIFISGYFLQNYLPNLVVGDVISSGLIPIIYVLIGLKVGSEITGVIDNFLTKEVV